MAELSKKDRERLILGIQAVIGIAAAFFAVRGSAQSKSKKITKVLDRDAKRLEKLHRAKYRLEKKAMKQKYRQKSKRNNLLHDFLYDKIN